MNDYVKVFEVYMSSLIVIIKKYLARKTQISLLLVENIPILAKYSDFLNDFLKKLVEILLKYIIANIYIIKLKKYPPLFYKLI